MRTETQSQRKGITNLTIFPSSRWWRKIVNRLQKKDAVKRLCCFNGSEIKVRVDAITLGTGSLLEKYEATLASVNKHRLKYQFGWAGCCNKRRQFDPPVAGNELVNKNRLLAVYHCLSDILMFKAIVCTKATSEMNAKFEHNARTGPRIPIIWRRGAGRVKPKIGR